MVNIAEIASYLRSRLSAGGIEVRKLIMFGSSSDGNVSPDSDIDFALVSPSFESKDLYERAEMTAEAVAESIWKFNVPIDLIPLTPEEYSNKDNLVTVSLENAVTLNY